MKMSWRLYFVVFGMAALVSAILILFIMGTVMYNEEHPKTLTYIETNCQVKYSREIYREYVCKSGRASAQKCYAPIWKVVYGQNQTINSTMIGSNRFRDKGDAIKKTNEYHVIKTNE